MSVRLTPSLTRAARGLAGWNEEDLAREAGIAGSTIAEFEAAPDTRAAAPADEKALLAAFDRAGVIFLPEDGGGFGVRRRQRDDGEDPTAATVPVEELNSSNDK